jgi:hypothetical protein
MQVDLGIFFMSVLGNDIHSRLFFSALNAISRSRAAKEKTEQRWNLFEPLKVGSFAAPGFSWQRRVSIVGSFVCRQLSWRLTSGVT